MLFLFPTGLFLLGAYKLLAYLLKPTKLRSLPGPNENPSWFFGFVKVAWTRPSGDLHLEFVREYGHVTSWPAILSRPRLMTTDPRALAHILSRTDIYEKPAALLAVFAKLVGNGLVASEGNAHRRQRTALNPAFGSAQLRGLTGIILDKANELCDVLDNALPPSTAFAELSPFDIVPFLSQCTLDIIGLAGFGYNFSSLSSTSETHSELYEAFQTSISFAHGSPILTALTFLIPGASRLPTPSNLKMKKAMHAMERIGAEILAERKALIAMDNSEVFEKPDVERPRDLLSLLVRANTSASPSDRLDDSEVLAQIPTFLGAGHETTSTLLSWILLCLARRPDMQELLRTECLSTPLSTASQLNQSLLADELDTLDKLPWLDSIIRETLRLHAPATQTSRVAASDDEIPLSRPFADRTGISRSTISIKKGDDVLIPIAAVNRSEAIWGEDAELWRPERWVDGIPEEAKSIPGVWGNVMSFISGPHGCIGYKFALYETKIILHALVSRFRFELGVSSEEVVPIHGIVTRPGMRGRKEPGGCLMMKLSRVKR